MTGFGKAESKSKEAKFTVEISSVNNRYLEISIKLPKQYFLLESKIRDQITDSLSRGKLNIWISVNESDDAPGKYLINKSAIRAYHKQLKTIKSELKLSGDIEISSLLNLPDIVMTDKDAIDEKKVWKVLKKSVEAALKNLKSMRNIEGLVMKKEMLLRITILTNHLKKVEKLAGKLSVEHKKKMVDRINALIEEPIGDKNRIEEEIAIIAEKTDITEECVRMYSHLSLFKSTINHNEAVGKKLNFILQEMNREVNTMGSKAVDLVISPVLISMKDEVEKIRELVQNVE